ncbi:MAG TPA: ATPase domain-containing protein [Bryobacteraceae bacterium]|jgi:circadian clock protein KaiC
MPDRDSQQLTDSKARTGVDGLDKILRGGLPRNRLYVVEGSPGSGKTTLALQFLLEGVRNGETVLYVTLSETAEELYEVARSHNWSLDGLHLLELDSLAEKMVEESDYTVYHPADVELAETTRRIREEVERIQPTRVALDSVSELKILSQTVARYRREILGFKQFFVGKKCTVLVLDDLTSSKDEQQLQSIAHGVIRMERETRDYGTTRRQLHVIKMRAVAFRDGLHDFVIRGGGVEVFPRLAVREHIGSVVVPPTTIKSGVSELDSLLGGGLDRSSSTLILGPAGCGKSTISAQFMISALERGEPVLCYLFEERNDTFLQRAAGLGMAFGPHIESGLLELIQIDPAEISPGEFANHIRHRVESHSARMVVIDSLNGYINAMPNERFLIIQMHELLTYLGQMGVVTLLVMAQHGMLGSMSAPVDVSFLADTVILLRYFEAQGAIRQAISVVKKRRGAHERTIREMQLTLSGVVVGQPLREFDGVLTGVPRYSGARKPLLKET